MAKETYLNFSSVFVLCEKLIFSRSRKDDNPIVHCFRVKRMVRIAIVKARGYILEPCRLNITIL
jgi:hypothetical protein